MRISSAALTVTNELVCRPGAYARVDVLLQFCKQLVLQPAVVFETADLSCFLGGELRRQRSGMPKLQARAVVPLVGGEAESADGRAEYGQGQIHPPASDGPDKASHTRGLRRLERLRKQDKSALTTARGSRPSNSRHRVSGRGTAGGFAGRRYR